MRKMRNISLLAVILVLGVACGEKEPDPVKPVSLSVPAGVKLNRQTDHSLIFQWDAVENAEVYSWKLLQGSAEVQTGQTRNTNAIIDALVKGTTYQFAVRAESGESASAWSAYVEGIPGGVPDTPSPGTDPDPQPGKDPVTDAVYAGFSIPEAEEDGTPRAFPGAEGGGMYTTGGRGGKVLHVTTLNDSGEGSLRWAVGQSGARTIVFDVAGVIELQSSIQIKNGNLTIAGQTAPGDGICLKNYTFNIAADNVIIRFLHFRLGDEGANAGDGEDCIWGRYHNHIVIDHCSMSWSIDECASFYANEFFTMQWCIIAESLRSTIHSKGSHGYGGIWGGKNASFHHNILAHHDSRNARIDHPHIYESHTNPARRGNVEFRNNVIYNWGNNSTYGGEGGWFNIVNNYYKPGPSSKDRKYFVDAYSVYSSCSTCGKSNIDEGYPELYMSGNVHTAYQDISSDNKAGIYWHNGAGHNHYNSTRSSALPIVGKDQAAAYSTVHTATEALNAVCSWGGASLKRDNVDTRVVSHVKEGKGTLVDNIEDVKAKYGAAWQTYTATSGELSKTKDTDGDGMPDWFEEEFGLDKANASDGADIWLDKNGRYTNLEMYLHYLVKEIVAGGNAGGSYNKL